MIKTHKETDGFFGYKFCHFFIMMLLFSLFGYLLESAFKLITWGSFDSNHHFFPVTFTYGLILLVLYGTLGTPCKMRLFKKELFRADTKKSKILSKITYAALLAFGVFFGEMLIGTLNYKLSGAVIWNYNFIPGNVKWFGCDVAFTSFPTTIAFTAAGWVFMRFFFTPIMKEIERIPVKVAVIISAVLGTLVIGDYVYTLVYTQLYGECPLYWTVKVFTLSLDEPFSLLF